MEKYLVVYESLWNNKYSYKTDKVGDTISEILKDFNLMLTEDEEVNVERLNEFPFVAGTMGPGFYDIDVYDRLEKDEDFENAESNGRIMLFFIGTDEELIELVNKEYGTREENKEGVKDEL